MLSMPTNEQPSSTLRRKISSNVFTCSNQLDLINRFLLLLNLVPVRTERRPITHLAQFEVSSKAAWKVIRLLDEIFHLHLEQRWLEDTRLHLSEVVLPLLHCNWPTNLEGQCPVTLLLRLSRLAQRIHEVNEMDMLQTAVIAIRWVGDPSMPHLLPEDESSSLHILSIPVISESESGKSGNEETEQELLLVLTLVVHLLDYPSTEHQGNILLLASPLIPATISDMAKGHRVHHYHNTTAIPDTILDKASEWISVVHRWYGMILEHIRPPRLLPVELRRRGSKRRTSLGQRQRKQRMKLSTRRAGNRPMVMARKMAVLYPIDRLMRVSNLDR
jgi:hypothetical protein